MTFAIVFISASYPKSAHRTRDGVSVTARSAKTSSGVRFFTATNAFPFTCSVKSDADAWLMAHPTPEKRIFSITFDQK